MPRANGFAVPLLCSSKLRHEIVWNERRVSRHGGDVGCLRRIRSRPAQSSQHARERTDEAFHCIGRHGKPKRGEPHRIAIGVEDDGADLSP